MISLIRIITMLSIFNKIFFLAMFIQPIKEIRGERRVSTEDDTGKKKKKQKNMEKEPVAVLSY